jgi:hypothetical protein
MLGPLVRPQGWRRRDCHVRQRYAWVDFVELLSRNGLTFDKVDSAAPGARWARVLVRG